MHYQSISHRVSELQGERLREAQWERLAKIARGDVVELEKPRRAAPRAAFARLLARAH